MRLPALAWMNPRGQFVAGAVVVVAVVLLVMLNHLSYHVPYERMPLPASLQSGTPEANQWNRWIKWDLFRRTASVWDVAAAVGYLAVAAYLLQVEKPCSQVGWTSFMWPGVVMPLLSWAGHWSLWLMLAAGLCPLAVVVQAFRRRIRYADLLSIPFYLFFSWRVWVWVRELDGIYR